AGGTSDSTPASRTWRVLDTTAPDTRISDGPSATSTDQSATFSFSSTEDGSTFQCSLDGDRKSTRLNSSHSQISYAVICLKKKNALSQSPKPPEIRIDPEQYLDRI